MRSPLKYIEILSIEQVDDQYYLQIVLHSDKSETVHWRIDEITYENLYLHCDFDSNYKYRLSFKVSDNAFLNYTFGRITKTHLNSSTMIDFKTTTTFKEQLGLIKQAAVTDQINQLPFLTKLDSTLNEENDSTSAMNENMVIEAENDTNGHTGTISEVDKNEQAESIFSQNEIEVVDESSVPQKELYINNQQLVSDMNELDKRNVENEEETKSENTEQIIQHDMPTKSEESKIEEPDSHSENTESKSNVTSQECYSEEHKALQEIDSNEETTIQTETNKDCMNVELSTESTTYLENDIQSETTNNTNPDLSPLEEQEPLELDQQKEPSISNENNVIEKVETDNEELLVKFESNDNQNTTINNKQVENIQNKVVVPNEVENIQNKDVVPNEVENLSTPEKGISDISIESEIIVNDDSTINVEDTIANKEEPKEQKRISKILLQKEMKLTAKTGSLICFAIVLFIVLLYFVFFRQQAEQVNNMPEQAYAHASSYKIEEAYTFSLPKEYVALTFNRGPSIYTESILKILKQHKVGATFFLQGNQVQNYPEMVKQIQVNGHSIGHITENYSLLSMMELQEQQNEWLKPKQSIENITGQKLTLFRPPYGIFNEHTIALQEEHQFKIVSSSISPKNSDKSTKIIEELKKESLSGAIIALDETKTTIEALPYIIEYIKQSDLQIVTLK